MREMTLEEMAMVTGGYYDNVEEIVVTGKKWESASVGGKVMIGLSAQDIANILQEGVAKISVDDEIPDDGIPLLVITAEKTNPPVEFTVTIPTPLGPSLGLGIAINAFGGISLYGGIGVGAGIAVTNRDHSGDSLTVQGTVTKSKDGKGVVIKGKAFGVGVTGGIWTQVH
jgi:hypothetical protein